jgi:hypothetical protein
MAKDENPKPKEKPKKTPDKEQAERFKETARRLGIDESAREHFEDAFRRIVPPKREVGPSHPSEKQEIS